VNQDEATWPDGIDIAELLMDVPDDCLDFGIHDDMNGTLYENAALLSYNNTDQDIYSIDSGADSVQVSTATSTHSVICFILSLS
jgi:hypothetical protein